MPVDRIPLGETIPAMSMLYVYMVPTPTDMCYKLSGEKFSYKNSKLNALLDGVGWVVEEMGGGLKSLIMLY